MAMKAFRNSVIATWRLGLILWCAQASAQPHWTTECPSRIDRASGCHLLPSEGLMALRVPVPGDSGGSWGFVNNRGEMVIPPIYDSVMAFSQSLAAARKGNKWGFIDQQGRWQIQPLYDDVTSFDAQGAAWSVRQGDLLRLNRDGQPLRVLPQSGEFDLDHRSTLEHGSLQVRLVPPPETWRLDSGEAMRWPTAVKEIGRVTDGAWPIRVKLPSGRVWWGIWSLQEGRWLASPQALRSDLEPIFHADQIAVSREGQWRFVDWQGAPLSEVRYRDVQMDQPGLWVASPAQSTWEWLGPNLATLHRIEGHVSSPAHQRWGKATVYDLGDTLLLCFPKGRMQRLDLTHHTEQVLDGWIWLSSDDEAALPDLIGPEGHSILTPAERLQLKGHRLEVLWNGERFMRSTDSSTSNYPVSAIRAILHPTDANATPSVITADLRVVTQADWAMVMPGEMPSDPVVVQRTDGRFGTIDGRGLQVIPPEWLGMERFHNGLTWGRHPTHEGGFRPVLISADGTPLPLPKDMFTSCHGWTGRWLRCTETSDEAKGTIFVDPLTQQRIQAPQIERLEPTRGGLLLARQKGKWGLIDDRGAWRMPPLAEDPDAISWLDDEVVRLAASQEGRLTHQLWHIATGRPLTTQPREGNSWRLGPDRYVVAGADAGMEMLDVVGRVVFRSPWWGSDPQAQDGMAWVTHGQRLARLHPDGSLNPVPIHTQDESDDTTAETRTVRSWKLRLSSRCGQLIVHGPTGRQTWPTKPVSCRKP